jgi:hypothetical protein
LSSCVTEKKDIEKEIHRLQQTNKQKWEQKQHDLHGFNSGKNEANKKKCGRKQAQENIEKEYC